MGEKKDEKSIIRTSGIKSGNRYGQPRDGG
jgi:hypothetical protein